MFLFLTFASGKKKLLMLRSLCPKHFFVAEQLLLLLQMLFSCKFQVSVICIESLSTSCSSCFIYMFLFMSNNKKYKEGKEIKTMIKRWECRAVVFEANLITRLSASLLSWRLSLQILNYIKDHEQEARLSEKESEKDRGCSLEWQKERRLSSSLTSSWKRSIKVCGRRFFPLSPPTSSLVPVFVACIVMEKSPVDLDQSPEFFGSETEREREREYEKEGRSNFRMRDWCISSEEKKHREQEERKEKPGLG